jgi:hypothetical protein
MIKPKDHVVWRKKGDLLVVLDTASGSYFTLNATAMDLWLGLLEEGRGLDAVARGIRDKFTEPPAIEQVEADCRKMLDEWQSQGLVEEVAGEP